MARKRLHCHMTWDFSHDKEDVGLYLRSIILCSLKEHEFYHWDTRVLLFMCGAFVKTLPQQKRGIRVVPRERTGSNF